ncbi:hypothetical protein BAX94_02935 [Elizabethkingia meningoseptica]|uniref:Uncharacterized protein n=1 Tax=Elizabethkingia meningoseptica TaxID=238 RepID=A0A1T3IK01_ELIME|nr:MULTISPECIES: hypothetical protein [Elizabethkingia]AQX10964.1 hypothetical protein BBD35_00600 [Elizabethkingia meningoseptica]MBG0512284.1 hypothetical protein [Elizabethkingia meningoseptica]MDE5435589.1 hypothetical protein [Elizabethkingia meningoseptica]MDE5448903.1 hypothetical protein [Elizabethkingia meningoseptica]MDE5472673.1 hypothetical protein [Elizabethkingia meningoseptica]
MKLYFLVLGILLSPLYIAQKTFSFKEKIHLKEFQNHYVTYGEQQLLQYINKNEKIQVRTKAYRSDREDSKNDFYQIDSVTNYKKSVTLNTSDFNFRSPKLYGDIIMEGDKLLFYPQLEKKGDPSYDRFIKDNIFFFNIPERSSVDVHYSSWHFGVLTLPLKVYFKSRSDSIKNNVILDTNINVMLGKKWGVKRYYNAPGTRDDKISTKSWSANVIMGITKVELDKFNTTPSIGSVKTNVTNFSYGLAFGYQLNKFGFFVATGIDTPLTTTGKIWNFSNRPWVGLGIGLGFW